MKSAVFRFSMALLLAFAIVTPLLTSCNSDDDTDGDAPPLAGDVHLADGLVLYGYDVNDSRYFLQNVNDRMGQELVSGNWSLNNCWNAQGRVNVGNKQFIVGHGTNCGDWPWDQKNKWFIQRVYTTGDLGPETDSGTWGHFYGTLTGFQVGDHAFIFGQNTDDDDHRWFIQEILPGGKMAGDESDSGYWHCNYYNVVPLYVSGRTYLFGQNNDDNFWFIKEVTSDGWLHDSSSGYWDNYWPTSVSYQLNGNTFLFGHRSDFWGNGHWFIQRINSNGTMGSETQTGEWDNYYATMTAYETGGRAFLFGHNTNRHWFIQEVYSNGTMGHETDSGDWDRHYDIAFTFAFDPGYLHHDDWMGYLSPVIGNRKLCDITLPGSHDAGMNEDDKHDCFLGTSCNTITQTTDISGQLNRGSRYFDIRPLFPKGSDGTDDWCTAHVQYDKTFGLPGCEGECKLGMIGDLQDFFRQAGHEKELVILKLSHFYSGDNGDNDYKPSQAQKDACARNLVWHLSDYLVKCEDDCNLMEMTLSEILSRGNIILLIDGVGTDKENGIFSWGDDLSIHDDYSNTESYGTMKNEQIEQLVRHAPKHDSQLFLLSWTLTLSSGDAESCLFTGKSILDLADEANQNLFSDMADMLENGTISKSQLPNILYVDAFDTFATRAAVYMNKADRNVALWSTGTYGNPGAYDKMQSDGNFVINSKGGTALWATGTYGNPGAYDQMQEDGNFVIYRGNDEAIWATGTYGNPGAYYKMQSDGNFVIYSKDGKTALWSTGTYGNPGAYFSMQDDGNFVIYSKDDKALWSSGTSGHPGAYFRMQSEGNFVIYEKFPLWASGTDGHYKAYSVMQSDGNFVIYSEPWGR